MTEKLAAADPKRRAVRRVASVLAFAASILGVAELTWGDGRVPGRPLESVIRLLESRSPGQRHSASLTKLKSKVSKDRTEELHQRILGKVFPPAPPKIEPPEDLLTNPPLLESAEFEYPPVALTGIPGDIRIPAGPPLYYGPPLGGGSGGNNGGGGSGSSGSGGGGGGSGGGPVVTPVIPEVPSAVPEPETWALMLLGAALSAAALRRGKSSQRRRTAVGADA